MWRPSCSAAIFLVPDLRPEVPIPAKAPQGTLKYAQLSELAAQQQPQAIVDDAATGLPKPVGAQMGSSGNVKRVRGDIAGGLYFSLRAAGASPCASSAW